MEKQNIVNFIFELGQLRLRKTSGWALAGINNSLTPSIAEHVLRATQVGYILAELEGVNAERVVAILLIHDNAETRTGDQHKVSARYFNKGVGENQAFQEQVATLGENISKKWQKYFDEIEQRNTKEGIVAKDADWLETAFTAKEFVESGYSFVQNWIDNVEKALETKSAQKLLQIMQQTSSNDWWKDLKKMTY